MNMVNDDFYGFPGIGTMGFGGLGMAGGWNFGADVSDNNYRHVLSHSPVGFNNSESRRATLEADVADDNVEYVRSKLYSLGAVSVT